MTREVPGNRGRGRAKRHEATQVVLIFKICLCVLFRVALGDGFSCYFTCAHFFCFMVSVFISVHCNTCCTRSWENVQLVGLDTFISWQYLQRSSEGCIGLARDGPLVQQPPPPPPASSGPIGSLDGPGWFLSQRYP